MAQCDRSQRESYFNFQVIVPFSEAVGKQRTVLLFILSHCFVAQRLIEMRNYY